MKKVKLIVASLLIAGISGVYSCKKDSSTDSTTPMTVDDTQSQSATSYDQSQVDKGTNHALDDANSAVSGIPSINGRVSGYHPDICGGTVDTSQRASRVLTINYDGITNCYGYIRCGSITISLNGKWKKQYTVMTITFNNYKLTDAINTNKSITINGSKHVTNMTGGTLDTLNHSTTAQIIHDVHGTLTLTIKDSTASATATWGIARKHTYTAYGTIGTINGRQVTISGDSTVNGATGVPMAGNNRYGVPFYITLTSPVIANNICLWHKPVSGVRVINGIAHPVTVTLGLDASGNPVVAPACATNYSISWTNAQNVKKTRLLAY